MRGKLQQVRTARVPEAIPHMGGGSSPESQGRGGMGLGVVWGLCGPLEEHFLNQKIRTGSDKCLTRKLLGIGADLGNCGLKTLCQGPKPLSRDQMPLC